MCQLLVVYVTRFSPDKLLDHLFVLDSSGWLHVAEERTERRVGSSNTQQTNYVQVTSEVTGWWVTGIHLGNGSSRQ